MRVPVESASRRQLSTLVASLASEPIVDVLLVVDEGASWAVAEVVTRAAQVCDNCLVNANTATIVIHLPTQLTLLTLA